MQLGASGSPSRDGFFELPLVREKRGWILRQQHCPNMAQARLANRTPDVLADFVKDFADLLDRASAEGDADMGAFGANCSRSGKVGRQG
jgi:hypothetical protein